MSKSDGFWSIFDYIHLILNVNDGFGLISIKNVDEKTEKTKFIKKVDGFHHFQLISTNFQLKVELMDFDPFLKDYEWFD